MKQLKKSFQEQNLQLEDKQEEIKRLKTEIIGSSEEMKRLNDKFNKSVEDLEETR